MFITKIQRETRIDSVLQLILQGMIHGRCMLFHAQNLLHTRTHTRTHTHTHMHTHMQTHAVCQNGGQWYEVQVWYRQEDVSVGEVCDVDLLLNMYCHTLA